MSLVIDIGNTRVKVAKFKNEELLKVVFLKQNEVLNELKKLNFKSGIISNVGNKSLCQKILKAFPQLIVMSYKLKLPIKIKYNSINSLGHDRVANVVGACLLYTSDAADD